MNSKIVLAALLVALCMVMGATVSVVFAQGETEPIEVQSVLTFGWIIASWLIYSFMGFFASGESFNGVKFAKTFLVTLIVAFIAVALKITPATVVTEYGPVLDQIATIILNTGPGMTLIYLLEKLWKIIVALKTKWEQAKQIAAGTGPPATA
jgi:membrane-bound acyltransferase YfiQ involved in biofilm formation